MSQSSETRLDELTRSAKDVSRHIGGLLDEVMLNRHPAGHVPNHKAINQTINRVRDQMLLLATVLDEIERLEHQSEGVNPA